MPLSHPYLPLDSPGGLTEGNALRLLSGGEETLEAKLEAVAAARERVWLETFILMPDRVGRRFLGLMEAAARRGADVTLVVDHPVSVLFSLGMYRPLERAGARVFFYNPLPPWGRRAHRVGSPLHRDHRKILIADGVGFCGGHNITAGYLGPGKRKYFDLTLRAEGPVIRDLAGVFADTLGQVGEEAGPLPRPAARPDGVPAAVHRMDRKRGISEADDALRALLRGARQRATLALAYFVPEPWLVEDLAEAARRGVDVRVMIAGKTDLPMARSAARHLYGDLLRAGVRVFEFRDQKLHAKAAVADGRDLLVGSFDYNRVSAEYSLEVALTARDSHVGRQLEDVLDANQERSREVHLADWAHRGPFARTTQRLMLRGFDALAGARRRGRREPSVRREAPAPVDL
jgi:cardiolipin synthase A/B